MWGEKRFGGGKGGATAEEDIKMKVSRNTRPSIEGKKNVKKTAQRKRRNCVKKWKVLQLRARAGADNMAAFYVHHNVIPLISPLITDEGIKARLAAAAAAPLAKD